MFSKARKDATTIIMIIIIICNNIATAVKNKNKRKCDRSAPVGLTARKQITERTSLSLCTYIHPPTVHPSVHSAPIARK